MKYLSIVLMCFVSMNLYAASEDECACWLCLLEGFASEECQDPKQAMEDRIRQHKSALPPLRECGGNDEDAQASETVSAYIPAHRKCTDWGLSDHGFNPMDCLQWEEIEEAHIPNTYCQHYEDYTEPEGCTRTDSQINVYVKGYEQDSLTEVDGSPYFFSVYE